MCWVCGALKLPSNVIGHQVEAVYILVLVICMINTNEEYLSLGEKLATFVLQEGKRGLLPVS